MNTKKLIVFITCSFLPMIAAGIALHMIGASGADADNAAMKAILASALTAGTMFFPLIAVIITQIIFKEPVLRRLDISFKPNRWWIIGWLLMPVVTLGALGVTLLMPGARWSPDSELMHMTLQAMPEGIGIWGVLGITALSGMFAGITINAVFAFGEEIAWRGYLLKLFKGKKFLVTAFWTGIIWGIWHAPIILNGHNYPQHPVAGVFMMIAFCLLLTPMLIYFRQKGGSVIVAAIMHGTFNGIAGISLVVITPANDLLYGCTGLAGLIVFLITDICLFIYDRFISKENIFMSKL